jgi:K+-transporting ATPase KdpF subunit
VTGTVVLLVLAFLADDRLDRSPMRSVNCATLIRRVRAADTRDLRAVGPGCEGGGAAVSAANLVGLVLSILVVGYLVLALLFPERF